MSSKIVKLKTSKLICANLLLVNDDACQGVSRTEIPMPKMHMKFTENSSHFLARYLRIFLFLIISFWRYSNSIFQNLDIEPF